VLITHGSRCFPRAPDLWAPVAKGYISLIFLA